MIKKDYTELARIIKQHRQYESDLWDAAVICLVQDIEDWLLADNPAFNHKKFRQACGLPKRGTL